MLGGMRSHIRPMATSLCLMFYNAFVLRSNGIITRTVLKHKSKWKRDTKQGWVRTQKKKERKKNHHRMDLILKRQNLGNKKAVIEIYFTNVIKICLKDRFQFCKAKEWNQENACFFAVEGKKLVTDDIKNTDFNFTPSYITFYWKK